MVEQMGLSLSAAPASEVRDAFEEGRLYLLVDKPVRAGNLTSTACGGAADAALMVTWVHVMSRPAGGEIRGYAKVGDELRLRLPEYVVEWPEVDVEVCRRLGCVRVVLPIPYREVNSHGLEDAS